MYSDEILRVKPNICTKALYQTPTQVQFYKPTPTKLCSIADPVTTINSKSNMDPTQVINISPMT